MVAFGILIQTQTFLEMLDLDLDPDPYIMNMTL
jgi:hypothetical protein